MNESCARCGTPTLNAAGFCSNCGCSFAQATLVEANLDDALLPRLASFPRRMLGGMMDGLLALLVAVLYILALSTLALSLRHTGEDAFASGERIGRIFAVPMMVVFIVPYLLAKAFFLSRFGATPGKWIARIRVVNRHHWCQQRS